MNYLKLIDTVYLFNIVNYTVSEYSINDNGYTYSCYRQEYEKYHSYRNTILSNKQTEILTDSEFYDFCLMLSELQDSANDLKPLRAFDTQISEIIKKYNIQMRKHY